MKLKCPGCSKPLQIPDSAVGKTVKCPCGQSFRVPAGNPVQAPKRPGPAGPTPARTVPARTVAAMSPDLGLMDELTQSDLMTPVASVRTAGVTVKTAAGHNKTGMYLSEVETGGKVKRVPIPIILYIVAALSTVFFACHAWKTVELVQALAAIESFKPGEEASRRDWFVLIFRSAIFTIGFLVAIVNCFMRKPEAWFLGLFWAAFIMTITFYPFSIATKLPASSVIALVAHLLTGIASAVILFLAPSRIFYQVTKAPIFKPIAAMVLGVVAGVAVTVIPFYL